MDSVRFNNKNRLRAMPHSVHWVNLFLLDMPNFKFYFTVMGPARLPMTDFLIDCYFNGFCKGRKNSVLTPCNAKKLHTMQHSAKLRLRAMPHSAKSRIRALPYSMEFYKKVLSGSLRYATGTYCEIQVKNFLVDSAICGTLGNHAMPHSGESWLRANHRQLLRYEKNRFKSVFVTKKKPI
jgi:hypothetical protein